MHEIAEFLSAHDPFAALGPEELERLAENVEIEFFEAGATIFRQGEGPPDAMWVVRTGAVELRDDGRLLDLLGEGEPFGHPWMLSGLPTGWEARAREGSLCYRLAAADVIPLLSEPASLRSVARSLMDRPLPGGPPTARAAIIDAGQAPARSLVRERAVLCEPDLTLRDAAARMEREQGAGSILVDLGGGELGIVTDRDLRSRAIAAGLPLDSPISEVMTTPVITAEAEQPVAELMVTMLDRGIQHIPVISARRELLGVISHMDLLAAETRTPFMLRRAIDDATSFDALRRPARELESAVIGMLEAGAGPASISSIVSIVVDALVRRTIELTMAEYGDLPAELGWLSLGSFGRREAVPSSDIDSGMVWSAGSGADPAPYMHQLAGRVVTELDAMGWRHDAHGVDATGAMSASSIADWRAAVESWLVEPASEPKLVAISIVLDARTIYGPARDLDVPSLLRGAHLRPGLLRLLLRMALASKPPTGFLRDIVVEHSGEHAGRFDIKRGGLLPIVNVARYAALAAGATTTSTVERLRAAAETGTLAAADAATLEEAFELFCELRLEHQVGQLKAGQRPDNLIDPTTLNKLTRHYLRDAFRAVASVQRSLNTKLAWSS